MTQASAAYGTLLQLGDGATPENFTTVAEVVNIGGPTIARDTIEVTNHSSAGAWEEFVAGLKRSGEVSISANYLPAHATQDWSTGLGKDLQDGTLRNFKLIFADVGATTWTFAAYVTAFNPSAPVEGKLGLEVTLKLSGQPTLA